MIKFPPLDWLRALPNDSAAKSVTVALIVSLVCSVVVATTAVLLRPLHEANRLAEQQSQFLGIVARQDDAAKGRRSEIVPRVIDLDSGEAVPGLDPTRFDARAAARDPARSITLPPKRDAAGLGRRANRAVVYLVRSGTRLRMIVLPVSGRGYGSTIHGYLGLSGDTRTVIGLSFYEHGETPGLGAQIDAPWWRDQWYGKSVWSDDGLPVLGVAAGRVDGTRPEARFQVDGLTGATWTSQGVTALLRFWLGPDGFGPFLEKIRRQGG